MTLDCPRQGENSLQAHPDDDLRQRGERQNCRHHRQRRKQALLLERILDEDGAE